MSVAVYLMHTLLLNQILPNDLQHTSIIRAQLIAEYGVDQLSATEIKFPLNK